MNEACVNRSISEAEEGGVRKLKKCAYKSCVAQYPGY